MIQLSRPRLPERPCPVCGAPIEPLRARVVLLFEDGFRFLCDAECRERFLLGERDHDASREPLRMLASPSPKAEPRSAPVRRRPPDDPGISAAHHALNASLRPPPWWGLGAAAVGALLGAFANHPVVAVFATAAIGGAAIAALIDGWPARREVGWLAWALAPAGALLAAIGALSAREANVRVFFVGAAVAAAAVLVRTWLDARANQPVADVTAFLLAKMPTTVRVPVGPTDWTGDVDFEHVSVARVRTGQDIVVREGEVVAVDGVVQAGEAFALLHPSARTPTRRGSGDPILAGARVVEGELRILATRVGDERALVRPQSFGDRRSHRSAPLTVLAARVTRWGGLAALVGAAAGFLFADSDVGPAAYISAAAAVLLAVPLGAIRRASETPYVAAAATAAERGIVFSSAHTLERAGRTAVAVLCTHGTVTEGEPEVVEMHAVGDADANVLAALAAGAETTAENHPIARAVLRFCAARGIFPESVRRATYHAGRGLTAVAPGGQELAVGNRGLLLAEGVSVAVADTDAARAEERGHTVVFVGLDRRVRALIILRDEDRLGARAAVQRLIDLGIEVVLMSGDHRGTVETLARHLDITHVKAELLPDERGAEVRRLRETGGVVATVGRPGDDESALSAADVPVVLGAAGAPESERSVALTSEDVRDAAAALWLARAARRAAWRGTLVAALGGAFLVALAATGMMRDLAPPMAALLALALDAYALPSASRLLRRIELRLPVRG